MARALLTFRTQTKVSTKKILIKIHVTVMAATKTASTLTVDRDPVPGLGDGAWGASVIIWNVFSVVVVVTTGGSNTGLLHLVPF